MGKPAAEFGDPQAVTKLHVDALVALDAAAGVDFMQDVATGTRLPSERPDGSLVVVRHTGWAAYQAPVTALARERVSVWALDEDTVWSIASRLHARLLALPGDADLVSYQFDPAAGGPAKGTDPDYDTPLATFTIRVRMRPVVIL